MKTLMKALLSALALLTISCENNPDEGSVWENPKFVRIVATTEMVMSGDTGQELFYKEGQSIKVWEQAGKTVDLKTNQDKDSVFFSYDWIPDAIPAYVAFPSVEGTTCSKSGIFEVTIEPQQKVVSKGKIENYWAVGRVTGSNRTSYKVSPVRNITGFIAIDVQVSSIESITIEAIGGESLTGKVSVDCSKLEDGADDFVTVADVDGVSSVTLVPTAEGAHLAAGTYCAAVLPGIYSQGLRLTVNYGQGLSFVKTYCEDGLTIDRSTLFTLDDEPMDDNLPDEICVDLKFSEGWPFNEPCAEVAAQTKAGELYTYNYEYTSDGQPKAVALDFMVSYGTPNTTKDYSYSEGALCFNSTDDSSRGLMMLPGIEGYYLNRVDVRHVSVGRSRFALRSYFNTSGDSSERHLEGYASSGALTIFFMPVTEAIAQKQQPGQSFTLEMREKNTAISEIRLVYTKTKPEGTPPLDLTGRHLFAHRGKWSKKDSEYFIPENSLTGIQMAALMGYEGIECDVKYTKDGHMVVMHDVTINKTMRNADYTEIKEDVKVADLTLDQLRNNYVLASTEPAFRLPCPTLEEMLLECKRCGMKPMLHSDIYESYELAQQIMGDDWVCFTGASQSDFENVMKVRNELNSKCTVLWSISSGFDAVEQELGQIGGDCGISSTVSSYYTPEMISRLMGAGYHVQCSIFSSGDERLAIENGVDYILSDRVTPEGARTDITAEDILAAYPPQSSVPGELPDPIVVIVDFTNGCPFDEGEYVAKDKQMQDADSYTYTYSYRLPDNSAAEKKLSFKIEDASCGSGAYDIYYEHNADKGGLYSPAIDVKEVNDNPDGTNHGIAIKLPGIAGRYLRQVKIEGTSANSNTMGRMSTTVIPESGSIPLGSEQQFPITDSKGKVWIESEMGRAYYFVQRRERLVIQKLTLTYTKSKPE